MSNLPSSMAAVVLTSHGDLDKLVCRKYFLVPAPASGEVLIQVTACGLNNTDVWIRKGANGVPEDPVSGVAQCSLMPYWAPKLGKTELSSRQLSPKGGEMHCKLLDAGVEIAGPCWTIFSGSLEDC